MPVDDAKQATKSETTTVTVSAGANQKAAKHMLGSILTAWTTVQTAKAAHPSMRPEDQQQVLDWMLEHQTITITKFTQVYTLSLTKAPLSLTMLPFLNVLTCNPAGTCLSLVLT